MSAATTTPAKKGRRFFWIFSGIAIVLILLIPLLVLGWLGLVPGLSGLLGADHPKDLGVQYSASDVQNYQSKFGITFAQRSAAPDDPSRPGKKRLFADPKPVDTTFTQEELSAALNSADLAWLPLRAIQIKLSNHTAEVSGLLSTGRIPKFLKIAAGLGFKEGDLAQVAAYAEKLADDVPVYIKAGGAVENSELNLRIEELGIGRFTVSPDVIAKAVPDGIHKTIKSSDHFAIHSATPREGSLAFSGILPTTIYLRKD